MPAENVSLIIQLIIPRLIGIEMGLAGGGEHGHDFRMLILGSKSQRRYATLKFQIAIRFIGEQQFDHFDVAIACGLVQWRPAFVAGKIDIGATGNQLFGGLQVAACGGLQ